jgi:hypothetical protein
MGAVRVERTANPAAPPSLRERLAAAPEEVAWIATIAGAILLAAVIAWVCPLIKGLYPSPDNNLFSDGRALVRPEPLEDVRSIVALATPFILAGAVILLGADRPSRRSTELPILVAQVAFGGLLIWALLGQRRQSGFLGDYFEQLLLSVPVLVAGLLIGLLTTLVAVRWRSLADRVAALQGAGQWWIVLGLAAAATAVFVLPAVVTDGTVGNSGPLASGHIPTQGEDYFAVLNGRTPLVNYISQYVNLLSIAVEPILRTFDGSITSFSITMCVLSGLGMLAIFGMFGEVTRKPWAALVLYVPWVALSLFPWQDTGAIREFNGNYYGVLPGRYFGPFILAWLIARSTRAAIPKWALFGFAGLVALNNWEFGSAALLAAIVAQLVALDRSKPVWPALRSLAVQALAGVAGALALVCAITLIRAGELPDPSLLTYYSRVFLREAYGLLPMPARGLHWAVYATYVAALLLAAIRFVRRDPDRTTTAMLAFSATFGLTSAMYFVGRSSQFQLILLFPVWGLALALVALVALRAVQATRGDRESLRRLLIPAAAALIGFGVMVATIGRISPPWRQIDRLRGSGHPLPLQGPADYVARHTVPGEHVLIIGPLAEHLIADRAGVVNSSPLNGVIALLGPAEANRALDQLEDEGGTQVFEGVSAPPPSSVLFRVPEFAAILRQRGYDLVAEDPSLHIRLWQRRTPG